MAHPTRRRPENVTGDFYVDDTCIDCDACRALAPVIFTDRGGQSAVQAQPQSRDQKWEAMLALVACPTASIGMEKADPDLARARSEYPIPVDADGEVLYCGYHSPKSFGAASYFLPRSGGNILIDCPREAAPLRKRLEGLGGVTHIVLTHGDDVADHTVYRQHFGCDRWIHEDDRYAVPEAEHLFRGDSPFRIDEDLLAIPVPGHTRGSCCFLYRGKYLFTGDHLAYSERRGHLYAFRDACWYSWRTQTESMERLLSYSFEWVLPGHGRRIHLTAVAMRASLEKCLEWMQARRG